MKDRYTVEELKELVTRIPLDEILNKRGVVYRERKDELADLNEEQLIEEMAKEPKLIRRPIIITDDEIIVGYNEEKLAALLK